MGDKAPSYQRYPQDFEASPDYQMMTLQECGAYNRLLDISWLSTPQCYLPRDTQKLALLLRISHEDFLKLWNVIAKKFRVKGDMIFNPRLLKERVKQRKRYRQAKQNGKLGGRPPKTREVSGEITRPVSQMKAIPETGTKPLSSSSSSSSSIEEKEKPLALAAFLRDSIKRRDPTAKAGKQEDLSGWAQDIDLLIRIDKRSIEEIREVITWSQAPGSFWGPNILSGKKLREKFDTMAGQLRRDRTKNKPDTVGAYVPSQQPQMTEAEFEEWKQKSDARHEVEMEEIERKLKAKPEKDLTRAERRWLEQLMEAKGLKPGQANKVIRGHGA